jgi:hypothetical protein
LPPNKKGKIKMKKFALEIRNRKIENNEICAWLTMLYDTEEALNESLDTIFSIKEATKKTHLLEVEYINRG